MKCSTLIIPVIMLGCTAEFDPKHLDTLEDASEDEVSDALPDVPEEVETDAHDGPIETEEPCGGPTDDCDHDGLSPVGGDCCDFDDRVHPGQDGWFSEPYYCPDESWDYDCSGEVEYEMGEYGDGIDAVLPEGIQKGCIGFNMSECNAQEGWVGGVRPSCGTSAEYVECFWYSNPYVSECHARDPSWSGMMRCR